MPGSRRRWLLLALLALAIPLPALALPGEQEAGQAPAPVALSVSTGLDSCGIAESQVVCKLDVSFNAIPGATSYSASVTRADGSVVDYGGVGAGGGSLWVPYTGSGTYSVRISAYGTPPGAEAGDPSDRGNELITSEATEATEVKPDRAGNAAPEETPGASGGGGEKSPAANASAGEEPGAAPPAGEGSGSSCDAPAPPQVPEEAPLPEPPPTDLDPNNPDEDDDGVDDAQERAAYELALTKRTLEAMSAQAELPDSIDCGEPVSP